MSPSFPLAGQTPQAEQGFSSPCSEPQAHPNQGTAQASSHLMVSPRSTNLPALASKAFWSTSSDADVCSQVRWVLPQSITHSASPAQCHQPGCLSSPEFWCQSLLISVNPSVFHLTDSASSSCTWDCASTLLSLFHLCSCLWTLFQTWTGFSFQIHWCILHHLPLPSHTSMICHRTIPSPPKPEAPSAISSNLQVSSNTWISHESLALPLLPYTSVALLKRKFCHQHTNLLGNKTTWKSPARCVLF